MSKSYSGTARSTRREFIATSALTAAGIVSGEGLDASVTASAGKGGERMAKSRAMIATICQQGKYQRSYEANREHMLTLVDQALAVKPDLICIPETFTAAGVWDKKLTQSAEPLDGPTITAFAKKAREGKTYVICPIMTRERDKIFNSAVVIDRSGSVTGVYHKACPVTTSPDYTIIEDGATPGGAFPVFDLDFGRIGIQICFDCGFPENWQKLADQGVRAVIWPSAYDGGFPLRCYAFQHHFWVISAVNSGQSRIIDPCGEVLKETGDSSQIIHRAVNLDYVVAHLDFNMGIEDRIKAKYGNRVDIRTWDKGSAHFVVEPVDESITTKQLCEEFGLEPSSKYFQRHQEAYREIKKSGKAKPQNALHGKRPQYGK